MTKEPNLGSFVMCRPLIYMAKLVFKTMHQSCTNNLQAAT